MPAHNTVLHPHACAELSYKKKDQPKVALLLDDILGSHGIRDVAVTLQCPMFVGEATSARDLFYALRE